MMSTRRRKGSRRTAGAATDAPPPVLSTAKTPAAPKPPPRRPRRPPRRGLVASCALLLATVTLAGAFRHAAFLTRRGRTGRGVPRGAARTDLFAVDPPSAGRHRGHGGRPTTARAAPRRPQSPALLRMSARPSTDAERAPAADTDTDADADAAGDEGPWRTVLSALRMYQAAYGDLKVPSKFVVPGMAPWPEPAWKMKLGQRVAAIRATGKYVQQNEPRRKTLDDMGFLWRLRSPSPSKMLDGIAFDQVHAALQTYRATAPPPDGGPLEVPPHFVVPDCAPWPDATRGLPLGKLVPAVRSPAYLRRHPGAEARLAALGLPPDAGAVPAPATTTSDARYEKVRDALARYKELYGDLRVPTPFTVPEDGDEWPAEVRGLRLGARVNAIRSQGTFVRTNPARKAELDALGFVWDPPADGEAGRRGRKRKDADDAGEAEAPDDGREPGAAGTAASMFATVAPGEYAFDTTRDPFFTGDQRSPPRWAFEGEDDEEALLEQQRAEQSKYVAKKSFNETLEEMAEVAMSVGIMERWTPQRRVKKGTRPKYVPWRNDDFGPDFVFEDVVEALSLYKELYHNFDSIEEDEFVVPEPVGESLRLSPFELASMNDDSPDELDEMDGPWSEDEDADGLESEFSVVAHDDWPGHLGGMKLGRIVSRIRDGGLEVKHLPERKARLDAIGFDWGDPKRFLDVPFEKVMCALYAYFMIRGDTLVVHDFVVPGDDPWPTVFAGFELGAAVVRLRELQNFLEAFHPVKMSTLRMIDFQFVPELALPVDPDAAEMGPEHMYANGLGHPLYHLVPVPLGLPERMLAAGASISDTPGRTYNYEHVREIYDGHLRSVPDWMREIGFPQLAEEHEHKYGISHLKQLFFLDEMLENKEIGQEVWDEEVERIQDEIRQDFDDLARIRSETGVITGTAQQQVQRAETFSEFDCTISEDEYYYQTLELASNSRDSSPLERPTTIPHDVIEESVAEFSLGGGDSDE